MVRDVANGFYFVKCSIIKYRKKDIALYPLGRDKAPPRKKSLRINHSRRVISSDINLYENRNIYVRLL